MSAFFDVRGGGSAAACARDWARLAANLLVGELITSGGLSRVKSAFERAPCGVAPPRLRAVAGRVRPRGRRRVEQTQHALLGRGWRHTSGHASTTPRRRLQSEKTLRSVVHLYHGRARSAKRRRARLRARRSSSWRAWARCAPANVARRASERATRRRAGAGQGRRQARATGEETRRRARGGEYKRPAENLVLNQRQCHFII